MKLIYNANSVKKRLPPSVIAVGVFDGLHAGHQKVISSLRHVSRKKRLLPVVVTFDPHPDNILSGNKKTPMLCSLKHRLNLLSGFGIEVCMIIKFNKDFAKKTCDFFIKDILVDKLGMQHLVVGESFSFGGERLTSVKSLQKITRDLKLKITFVPAKRYNRHIISSSAIRSLIEKGRLDIAPKLLGRKVSVLGTVVHGQKRGRIIGFKTANIDPHHEAIPPSGVYAAYTRLENKKYKSVVNIGRRPTFHGKDPSVEVHIFGIDKNIYGKDIEVFFVARLRSERRFKDEDSLRKQIKKDAIMSRNML